MDNYGLYGVFVYHRIGDEPDWTSVGMSPEGGYWWSGEIPELTVSENTIVRYYIHAIDLADPSNESVDPPGAPSNYYEFLVYGVEEEAVSGKPGSFDLFSANPNPSKGQISISYAVPVECAVSLKVFDVTGQHVSTLYEGTRSPGYYEANWNGMTLSQGVYFVRLETDGYLKTRRVLVVR
jgi:hypothetical protein